MVVSPQHFTQLTNGYEQTTSGLWTHKGNFVPTAISLPANSVGTSQIQSGAVQQLIGSYAQAIAFTVSTTNVWTETPIQVNATCSGAQIRIEFNVMIGCPVKGQRIFWSIMIDGTAPPVAIGALDAPEAGYGSMASGTYYLTPSAIAHRFSFGMFGPSGSVVSNAFASTLFITEQKR